MDWKTLYTKADPFQRTVLWTLGATFFLIFVGGLVRAAGAGLGCPDWPRCFGLWIPPLSPDDLPAPYDPEAFNAFKTWLEYVNRLVGVTVGLFILATFVRARRYVRTDPSVFRGALTSLLLVVFQGWLGGKVVQSELAGWMITIHMLIALLILNVLLFTLYRSMRARVRIQLNAAQQRRLTLILSTLIAVTLLQVALGTQVREALAHVPSDLPRAEWLESVGARDIVHRSLSWLVLGSALWFYSAVRAMDRLHPLRRLAALNNSVVLMQIVLGAGLAYGGLPPALQIFHLVFAALMTSVQFLAFLFVRHASVR